MTKSSAKRVSIVSVKLVRESSNIYERRNIRSPQDAFDLFKSFLEGKDREHFMVVSLDTKNQPVSIDICHICLQDFKTKVITMRAL
ncbi:hypothetical protein ABE67_19055 [Cytobacillus firmus]|uniref:JAB domain-containing protein n=1 Tax=Cytobacillus firmus TaxID=1399 RepID=UPI0018CF3779|nr:JAB domain-containing protein [Cytobacillus firmus]MBG9451324.1 hypothetical protein [Cytobacillus firmus]